MAYRLPVERLTPSDVIMLLIFPTVDFYAFNLANVLGLIFYAT